MPATAPERRTAMYHAQLAMGAVMSDADGWRLPAHYGDAARETAWLRETVGVSDISPIGKARVVGADAAQAVLALLSHAAYLPPGSLIETGWPPTERHSERREDPLPDGKLLAACLAPDEFLLLTPPGLASSAIEAIQAANAPCCHAIDVTSGLCGVALIGPAAADLLSRVTELDVSPRARLDLTCVQTRIAEIQGLLLRRDTRGYTIWHLYASREFGEYLWEVLIQAAQEVGGGPAGTEALLGLRGTD